MSYLFWSQTIIWAVLAAYLIILAKKSKQIGTELDIIRKDLDKDKQ